MTSSVQPLLVGVPQPSTSDKSREDICATILSSSAALLSSEEGDRHAASQSNSSQQLEISCRSEQSLLLSQRQAASPLDNQEIISGRRNPGPTVLGMSTSKGKTLGTTPVPVLPNQATDTKVNPNPPGNGGSPAPVRESVAIKVIRPFPVKTVPQNSVTTRHIPEDVAPIPSESKDEDRLERQVLVAELEDANSRPVTEDAAVAARAQESQSQNQVKFKKSQCDFPPHPGHIQHMPPVNAGAVVTATRGDQQNVVLHAQQTDGDYHQQQRSAHQPYLQSTVNLMSMSGGSRQSRSRNLSVGGAHMDMDGGTPTAAGPAPLFERLVSEEVQEIKTYARIVESQNRQIEELARVHDDLERRLELLDNEKAQLQATLEDRERSWSAKFAEKEKIQAQWEKDMKAEKQKNKWLEKTVGQKDKDINRMLARKFDTKRDQAHNPRNLKLPGNHSERSRTPSQPMAPSKANSSPGTAEQHKSPHELYFASGSIGAVREGNVAASLLDFFGM